MGTTSLTARIADHSIAMQWDWPGVRGLVPLRSLRPPQSQAGRSRAIGIDATRSPPPLLECRCSTPEEHHRESESGFSLKPSSTATRSSAFGACAGPVCQVCPHPRHNHQVNVAPGGSCSIDRAPQRGQTGHSSVFADITPIATLAMPSTGRSDSTRYERSEPRRVAIHDSGLCNGRNCRSRQHREKCPEPRHFVMSWTVYDTLACLAPCCLAPGSGVRPAHAAAAPSDPGPGRRPSRLFWCDLSAA